MIDWNLEEQKAIDNKTQIQIDLQAKKEAERQQNIQQQIQYDKNCIIFDQVIAEEIENYKAYLNKYMDFIIEVSKGHVYIFRCGERGKHNWGNPQDIYCTNSSTEDVATWTRKQLVVYVMENTVNYS